MANKLVITSIYTHNWESVMNLNNRMLNIDKKTLKKNKKRKKRKKQIKNRFFHKKPFFIEIKNQKIKNGFLYNTRYDTTQRKSSYDTFSDDDSVMVCKTTPRHHDSRHTLKKCNIFQMKYNSNCKP